MQATRSLPLAARALSASVAVAVAAALAGCAGMGNVAPVQSSKLDAAQLKPGKALADMPVAPEAWPASGWWRELHDPQLDRLMAQALAGSPSLKASLARVRLAEAAAGSAEAATKPRVNGGASINREHYAAHSSVPPPLAGHNAWRNEATLSGSYDLDLWGRNRDALAAALDDVHMASAEARVVQLALETAIVHSYIQLARACAMRDAIDASLQGRRDILALTKRRHAAGLASNIDVANIVTTLAAGERQVEEAEKSISLLRNRLAALIGQGPGDGDTIARPVLTLNHEAALPSALPAELIGRRPDIAAQRWRAEAEAKRINVAQAAFYPNINLVAFAGMQAFGFSRLLQANAGTYGVAPAVSLPIFDGGRLRAQLGGQHAVYDMAVEQYNATVVQALSEVADAVTRVQSAREQEELSARALAAATQAHTLAERAYRAGMTDAMPVLQARLTLLAEEQQMVHVHALRLDNYATLMASLGGGLKQDFP